MTDFEPKDSDRKKNDEKSDSSGKDKQNGSPQKGPNNPSGPQNFMSRNIMVWVLLGMLAVFLLVMMNDARKAKEINWAEFLMHVEQKHFVDDPVIAVDNEWMVGELRPEMLTGKEPGEKNSVRVRVSPEMKETYVNKLIELGQEYREQPSGSLFPMFLITWGPMIFIGVIIYFFFFRAMRGGGGGGGMLGNFGRSKHKVLSKEHTNVTLDDVAGIDEAKDEVLEIVEFLKNPKKFQRLGGRVPRGVLLMGAPGCGKTLLAKAVAGEADVPFFSISGSDFVEMFVGVGASRVRDLFKQAKDSSPCIIFLDEIDAVGRRRGSGFSSGGHDEREQTLNAILVEMDGFETDDQVIVMAATNRSDVLDPALIRPGRFDRQITVPHPDVRGRFEILKVHARRVKTGPDIDFEKLARGTPMFPGADLEALINEAAISATLQGKDFVEQADLEEARDKVRWGRSRKSQKIEEDEKKIIAYHEAGHAVIMFYDDDTEPLHKVTIIPRGQSLGATFLLPEKDKHLTGKKNLLGQLRTCFGGRIAEEMFCGDQYTGTASDIRQATAIARAMVTEHGMSDKLGFQMLGVDEGLNPWEQADKLFSDVTAQIIDEEIKKIIDNTYNEAKQLIIDKKQQTIDLAEALLKYETLNSDEAEQIFSGKPLSKPTVLDLIKAEQDKQDADDQKAEDSDTLPEDDQATQLPGGPDALSNPA